MGNGTRGDASIQAYFPPTPTPSPTKPGNTSSSTPTLIGDGFTAEEVQDALKPAPLQPWSPPTEYEEVEIQDLMPGPKAVTFMGRVANIFDVQNAQKTPRSARGCLKVCVKDDGGAVTVRLWYANRLPNLRLGCLVSVWTAHVSNGENGSLSSASAPLFASLFPERDKTCHLMVHENSDDGQTLCRPLGYREGRPLSGVMTLQNFIDGGYDVIDAKILVVVKSIGAKKTVTRKDESSVDNVEMQVHDDTAEATFGLWGTAALSPSGIAASTINGNTTNPAEIARQGWKSGETVLLLQAPAWKIGRRTYLSLNTPTIVDINPSIPDADWLRRWSARQRSREAINPAFPEGVFDLQVIETGPVRCLFTIAELDEFARAAPKETFQGYLSVLIMEVKLFECWKRRMLCCGECCNMPAYANDLTTTCRGCDKEVPLRLSPRILGQVIDETAAIGTGKLLFGDRGWKDLLGRGAGDLLKMNDEGIKHLADRLLFCRVTLLFGWTGDEAKAGGRICVLGVRA